MRYTIEKYVNKSIPEEIKTLIETKKNLNILLDNIMENFVVLSSDEILEAYKEQEDLFDYNIIPLASLDDDFLCLYYQNNNISIIYWSTERAFELKEMAIFELYSSWEEFVKECITNKPPI